jgi:hypothetical protein
MNLLSIGLLLSLAPGAVGDSPKANRPDYLEIVTAYADALLDRGRDTCGEEESPLIATTLDRKTLKLFEGPELERIKNIPQEGWGIRPHDRMPSGANPQHDQNLYQILYALSEITGNRRYAAEADKTLKWFFEHCQSDVTGLLAWGEHIGWDFHTESVIDKPAGTTHEYFRPWVLWDRAYGLAPAACERFALGVWEHQIGDHATGNFSRHAGYDRHGPGRDSEYPRHGGFYIATWAAAYGKTGNPVFLKAIETLLDYFDGRRSPQSDAIPAESAPRSRGQTVWPPSNLSLAVDLWEGAEKVPQALSKKMRHSASRSDAVFLAVAHDLSPGGAGFVGQAEIHTLKPQSYSKGVWKAGYGTGNDTAFANLCLLRYDQVKLEGYRKLIVQTADRYAGREPDLSVPLHPGTFGNLVFLMVKTHDITGEEKYLTSAEEYADTAIGIFLDDSPLPRATSQHEHYEAITMGDTLMMGILELWAVKNRPQDRPKLISNDR